MAQQYRQTKQSVEKMGVKLAQHIEENQVLRQAMEEGDYVTRDKITMQRTSRKFGRAFGCAILPLIILFFVKFSAFIVLLGWLGWQWYAGMREVRETVRGYDRHRLKAMRAVRRVVSVGLFTLALLLTFSSHKDTLGMFAFFGGIATVVCAMYAGIQWSKLPKDQPVAQPMEEEDPITEADIQAAREELDRSVLYGFSKSIPSVLESMEHTPIIIEWNDRRRFSHACFVGKTGSGKTTFLRNLICQDIRHGAGVVVMSHERDLFQERILPFYSESRLDDLIYYNPANIRGKVIGFNLFELSEGENPSFKAGEIYTVFERTLDDLGASMKPILQNAIDALVYMRSGKTLRDLENLIDPDVDTVRQEVVRSPHVSERRVCLSKGGRPGDDITIR
jgi:hypothetical protein